MRGLLGAAGGDKDKALAILDEMKATNNRNAAVVVVEDSDFDANGRMDTSKVYQQFLKKAGGHAGAIGDLREAFLAAIEGAKPGEARDISFLYNVAYEYSAVKAYQLADEDAKKRFGPDFIQRNAHLLGQYGAAPQDVSLKAGAALAMDTIGAASLGLGIYRAGAALARGAAVEAEAVAAPNTAAAELKPGQVASAYPRGRRVGGRGEGVRPTDPPAGTREVGAFDLTPENLAKMERGRPPIGRDGLPVELHHRGQNPAGPLDEIGSTTHDTVSHPISPSQIDRGKFAGERARYWRERARELLGQQGQK